MPRFMLFSSKMLRSLGVGWTHESRGSLNSANVSLLSHSLHTNAPFVSKKDKNLIGWVIVGRSKEVELVPAANQKRTSQVSISQKEWTRMERTRCYPSGSRITV